MTKQNQKFDKEKNFIYTNMLRSVILGKGVLATFTPKLYFRAVEMLIKLKILTIQT